MTASRDEGDALLAERCYGRLIAMLREGELAGGQFLSMPALAASTGYPLAATREAVKRAEVRGLLGVMPKRGVVVMRAEPKITRDCLDFRAMLDAEGARRLIDGAGGPPLAALRASHEAVLADARRAITPDLPRRAMVTDLSLHDALAAGLGNAAAAEAYAVNRDKIAVIQNSRPFLADRVASAMEEHLAIIEALERGDALAATEAIRHHHRTTLRWWGVEI